MAGEHELAALVPKPETEDAIAALREEGVYDDTRRAEAYDDERVALPVVEAPSETAVEAVESVDLAARATGLDTVLRDRGWSEAEIARAPSSWAVLGSVVLVTLADCPDEEAVGEALLELHGEADTVLATEGVSGELREPDVRVVAGAGDTETVHTEHGVRYGMDLAEVMFSPGNKAERRRMGETVSEGERVLDPFAGIGYFALPMAVAGADVTAVEKNPTAFRQCCQNAVLNGVQEHVAAFRGDCRDVVPELDAFERVVMGYYDAHAYLDVAIDALEPGGVVHLHEATPEDLVFDRPERRLREAAADADRAVTVLDRRRVKEHSPGVAHVVLDARLD